MKLLSPLATKDKGQEELAKKIIRIQEVEDLAVKSNVKLARAEADFNATLARNRTVWAIEEQEHADSLKSMREEVETLEKRKEQALIPIYVYKEEADKLVAEAQNILRKAKEKDEQSEFLQEKLMEKLTEVSDRESIVAMTEKKQQIAQEGIDIQKEQTKLGVKQLSVAMTAFHEKQEREEANLVERKKEVYLIEVSLKAQQDKLASDYQNMRDREIEADRQIARLKGFEKFEL